MAYGSNPIIGVLMMSMAHGSSPIIGVLSSSIEDVEILTIRFLSISLILDIRTPMVELEPCAIDLIRTAMI
jgi:hypothetical protein